jgi:hypothetical protein
MAGLRKSRAQHEASGAAKRNPKRFEIDPHTPPVPKEPIKKASRHLSQEQMKVRREIVSSAPEGLLGTCDELMIEVAVNLIIKMRTLPTEWKSSDASTLAAILGKLGGSPGDRMRLNVTAPAEATPKTTKEDDEWAGL